MLFDRSINGVAISRPLFKLVHSATKSVLINARELVLLLSGPSVDSASRLPRASVIITSISVTRLFASTVLQEEFGVLATY